MWIPSSLIVPFYDIVSYRNRKEGFISHWNFLGALTEQYNSLEGLIDQIKLLHQSIGELSIIRPVNISFSSLSTLSPFACNKG